MGLCPTPVYSATPAGNLYGTTSRGGASEFGTVFKLDTNDKESVLYSFGGSPDGAFPFSGLVQDNAGSLYGTTDQGGASGAGAVFKLDTAGTGTVLHSFAGSPDGSDPQAGLVLDAAGHLYGVTAQGGSTIYGTVFKLDTAGTETVLHSFVAGSDGLESYAGLVRDAAGNLYGTTMNGGNPELDDGYGNGMVFKIDKPAKKRCSTSLEGRRMGHFPALAWSATMLAIFTARRPLVVGAGAEQYSRSTQAARRPCCTPWQERMGFTPMAV